MDKELIFDIVDKCLHHLSENHGDCINFDIHKLEGIGALEVLEKYDLIQFMGLNKRTSISYITNEGWVVINNGGIRNYLKRLEQKEELHSYKEKIELEKLIADHELVKRQLSDYRANKWVAWGALALSVFLAIIEFVKFVRGE